jgi:hypothetical protein
VIAVVLLILLVTPACPWMFNWKTTERLPGGMEPNGGPHGGGLVYPVSPPEISDAPSLFVAAEPGTRSLGGIFVYDGRLVIIRAKPLFFDPPRQESDIAIGLAFGQLVAEHHIDRLDAFTEDDCLGDGDDLEGPIQPQKVTAPDDEVAAGIACARLRNPGATWIASKLLIGDRYAAAFVLLERQDGERIGVYTDVTRFVRQRGGLN